MAERRTTEDVHKLALEAKTLVDAGSSETAESKQVGISRSVYDRHIHGKDTKYTKEQRAKWASTRDKKRKGGSKAKRGRGKTIMGSIDVRSLPPRPKKHGGDRRAKQNVDMNSVRAIAGRITYIDRLLAKYGDMAQERRELSDRLIMLLKAKPLRS